MDRGFIRIHQRIDDTKERLQAGRGRASETALNVDDDMRENGCHDV